MKENNFDNAFIEEMIDAGDEVLKNVEEIDFSDLESLKEIINFCNSFSHLNGEGEQLSLFIDSLYKQLKTSSRKEEELLEQFERFSDHHRIEKLKKIFEEEKNTEKNFEKNKKAILQNSIYCFVKDPIKHNYR
jgi:hypothetical protein